MFCFFFTRGLVFLEVLFDGVALFPTFRREMSLCYDVARGKRDQNRFLRKLGCTSKGFESFIFSVSVISSLPPVILLAVLLARASCYESVGEHLRRRARHDLGLEKHTWTLTQVFAWFEMPRSDS